MTLTERLTVKRPVLMDGAINTELSRKGILFTTMEWLRVNLDDPRMVADIHQDYARAGAELHIANSFASARHVLEPMGLGDDYEALNRAAVTQAASHPQWIAGSLSTYAAEHNRRNLPAPDVLERNFAEQSLILADAGCDMLALEMLFDIEVSVAMVKGAEQAGVPISIGLVCVCEPDGQVKLFGTGRDNLGGTQNVLLSESLPRILDALRDRTKVVVSIMHCEVGHVAPILAVIRKHWDGLVAAYPNIGHYAPPGGWDVTAGCSAHEFANGGEEWIAHGINIVGGCCGAGPEHIRMLASRMNIGR